MASIRAVGVAASIDSCDGPPSGAGADDGMGVAGPQAAREGVIRCDQMRKIARRPTTSAKSVAPST
ncbi:MAG: hypothetical protein VYC34_04370, partial [Planctomycetota bacterium]|nr:hypothetical protein [Planctomycetota bacterium]